MRKNIFQQVDNYTILNIVTFNLKLPTTYFIKNIKYQIQNVSILSFQKIH